MQSCITHENCKVHFHNMSAANLSSYMLKILVFLGVVLCCWSGSAHNAFILGSGLFFGLLTLKMEALSSF